MHCDMQNSNLNSQDALNIIFISGVVFLTNTLMALNSNVSIILFLRLEQIWPLDSMINNLLKNINTQYFTIFLYH